MKHILDISNEHFIHLDNIFNKICSGKAILFLGAGASVTDEKKYLSSDLIKLYEAEINQVINTNDVTEFIDYLSAQDNFSREHFDTFVFNLLEKLEPSDHHRLLTQIPWLRIISTNMDLLLERVYDEMRNEINFELVPVRNRSEKLKTLSKSQIPYFKLNGCCKDRKKYPFVFSTKDINYTNKFYKTVLDDLRSVSDDLLFISIGYSYEDNFAKKILDKFDSYDFRGRRIFYSVDPFVSSAKLDFLSDNNICIIKCSFKDFMNQYKKWHDLNNDIIVKSRRVDYFDFDGTKLPVSSRIVLNNSGFINQLAPKSTHKQISAREFYMGEEPNYGVILKNYDVIRKELLEEKYLNIVSNLERTESNIIPIILITGEFGIGKSTFAYRLLNFMIRDKDSETLLFEITDPFNVDYNSLIELLRTCKAQKVYLYFNFLERHSVFTSITELRSRLSQEQIENLEIIFFASVRGNLLERYKLEKAVARLIEIPIGFTLSNNEVEELIDKLDEAKLLQIRDKREKRLLFEKINNEFNKDSYLTLLKLIPGKHHEDLLDAYQNLPDIAKDALIYTSLLFQFNILMPVGVLKNVVADNWEIFRNELMGIDCKGILINEKIEPFNSLPDLFFKTRHPIIAQTIINNIIPNKDDQYNRYKKLISHTNPNDFNVRLIVDLFKSFDQKNYFNKNQIDTLFDIASNNLSDNPHFLLYYSINLQKRNTISDLKKALKLITYAEGLFNFRNHKYIHRRAIINFELSKKYYDNNKEQSLKTIEYLKEATELFEIKLILDPCSTYSFVNYIELLIWKLNRIKMLDTEYLRTKIKIEELFDFASKTIFEGTERLISQHMIYFKGINSQDNEKEYLNKLDNFYKNETTRELSLILKHNFFEKKNNKVECNKIVDEIEHYTNSKEAIKFLFKYYGRNLNRVANRLKFLDLTRQNQFLAETEPLRFNFFMYIVNDYNRYFDEAKKYLDYIRKNYYNLHPDYRFPWKDENDKDIYFDCVFVKSRNKRFRVKVIELQRGFSITNYKEYSKSFIDGKKVTVKLFFYLYGIQSEIVKIE